MKTRFALIAAIAGPLSLFGQATNKIDSTGNVGIGTLTPAHKLVVSDGGAQGIEFMPAAGNIFSYNRIAGAYAPINIGGSSVRMNIAGTTKFTINGAGKVGINTEDPSHALEVNGNIANYQLDQYFFTHNIDVISSSTNAVLYNSLLNGNISIGTGLTSGMMKIGPSAGGINILGSGGSGKVGIGTSSPRQMLDVDGNIANHQLDQFFLTHNIDVMSPSVNAVLYNSLQNANISIGTGLTSGMMKIGPATGGINILGTNSYGRVGIGTSSPSQMLEVNGNIRITSASNAIYVNNIGTISNSEDVVITGGNSANIVLKTAGTGVVSIPTNSLQVNGNIRAKKVTVTQMGWPDYVFADDYKLTPLSEVETFIKSNKHLPEMPSAKHVEEHGADVGNTQALLLKKIEELTLHLIEMKKKQDQLEKDNNSLRSRVAALEK